MNRRWQNRQNQQWEEATSFFDVVCWREMAENASESLTKGARVLGKTAKGPFRLPTPKQCRSIQHFSCSKLRGCEEFCI
ncbi:MAG: single-stranded DNA-binding protein [Actinobacteria bacterium]|nr:single-stranded DNA-binding protein [Actinomycetota bacterium]